MNSGVRTARPAQNMVKERIVGFSAEDLKAPFLLRCGAIMIDYMLVLLSPVICLLLSALAGYSGSNLIDGLYNNIGWLIAIFIGITNLIILPAALGRSVGKMVTGLRIVRLDGTELSLAAILFRNVFGYFLTLASFGLGFLFSVFSSKGRALHDYLAGTVVIHAGKQRIAG